MVVAFIIVVFVIFGIFTFFQIKVELYRKELVKMYNFEYLTKERKRYTPFVWFFYESKELGKYKCYWWNIRYPYEDYYRKHNIEWKMGETYYEEFNIEYNAYLMYCYFDLPELNCPESYLPEFLRKRQR